MGLAQRRRRHATIEKLHPATHISLFENSPRTAVKIMLWFFHNTCFYIIIWLKIMEPPRCILRMKVSRQILNVTRTAIPVGPIGSKQVCFPILLREKVFLDRLLNKETQFTAPLSELCKSILQIRLQGNKLQTILDNKLKK